MDADLEKVVKRLKEQVEWWEEYKADALEVKQTIDAKLCFSEYKVKTYAPGKLNFVLMCDKQIKLLLEHTKELERRE